MNETELWERMMADKADGKFPYTQAYAHLTRPITMNRWNGQRDHEGKPIMTPVEMNAGDKVRVVMASRLGDVGITNDLNAISGYHYRSTCIEDTLRGEGMPDIPLRPTGLLTDIELIER